MGRGYLFLTRKSKIGVRQSANVGRRAVVAVGRWGAAAVGVLRPSSRCRCRPLGRRRRLSNRCRRLSRCQSESSNSSSAVASALRPAGERRACNSASSSSAAAALSANSSRPFGVRVMTCTRLSAALRSRPIDEGDDEAGGDVEASCDVALGRGVARVYGCEQSNLFVGQAQPLHTLGKGLCYLGSGHAQAEARRLEDRHAVDVVHAKRVTL